MICIVLLILLILVSLSTLYTDSKHITTSCQKCESCNVKMENTPEKSTLKLLLSKNSHVYNCATSPVKLLSYPPSYVELKKKFEDFIVAHKFKSGMEGNSGQETVETQYKFYHKISQEPWVKTICETGFNGGHSAFQWLASTPKETKLHSFDICQHAYTPPMVAYLNATFPGRLNVTCGDSTKTLPLVTGLDNMCNLVIVDGGHSYDVAMADLKNFKRMANMDNHILIIDDVPNIGAVKKAWNKALADGMVREIFVCASPTAARAFTVGVYN